MTKKPDIGIDEAIELAGGRPSQLAHKCGVSLQVVTNWIARGKISDRAMPLVRAALAGPRLSKRAREALHRIGDGRWTDLSSTIDDTDPVRGIWDYAECLAVGLIESRSKGHAVSVRLTGAGKRIVKGD